MSDEPLRLIDPLLRNLTGAVCEGDVFSILRHSPFVVRSFEFALEDGAVDCTKSFDVTDSWSDRFSAVVEVEDSDPSLLVPFEVKSDASDRAGRQACNTFDSQRRRAAFFVCMHAANPQFVDLVPNLHQDEAALEEPNRAGQDVTKERALAVAPSRRSRFRSRCYDRLDQCATPYRMPIGELPEAICRVRRCVLTGEVYVNPWTEVAWLTWRPMSTRRTTWLRPGEGTSHFTAFEKAMDIRRAVTANGGIVFDFIGLQPRLADFSLNGMRIQHKADTDSRRSETNFSSVLVAFDIPKVGCRYFFSVHERFDFLFYSFECAGEWITEVAFCIPEKEIPDDFYTALETRQSFERFAQFRFNIDNESRWVRRLLEILAGNPRPRRPGTRPARILPPRPATPRPPQIHSPPKPTGRSLYEAAIAASQQGFFDNIMQMCADRGAGLLAITGRNHVVCDLFYTKYAWSTDDLRAWRQHRTPPQFAHTLPAQASVVAICVYARHRESYLKGPDMTAAQFRRLDASSHRRLLCWDLGEHDGHSTPLPPVVVPSEDVQPSGEQRDLLSKAARASTAYNFHSRLPSVSALLASGLYLSEYRCQSDAPFDYGSTSWLSILHLLDRFANLQNFEYPPGHLRHPAAYRHALRDVNQALQRQHATAARAGAGADFEEPYDIDEGG